MKTQFKITSAGIFLILFLISNYSFSRIQDLKINKKTETKEELRIEAEIKTARDSEDKDKMLQLQNELDALSGTDSKPGEPYAGTFVFVDKEIPHLNSSAIDVTEITYLNGERAIATATEQRGVNAGRIWTAVAISNSSAHDTVYYYRSDNNGASWTLYGFISLGNSDEVNYDQMDLEIIENTTGDKYLWTVYGLTASNGKEFVGYCTLRTPGFAAGLGAIAWPGENYSNTNFGHSRPRITSDNARYLSAARIYICASEDSLEFNLERHAGKICYVRCVDPYTTSPVFSTYTSVETDLSISSNTSTDIHVDMAYVNFPGSGGDLLIPVISNVLCPIYGYNYGDIYYATLNLNFNGDYYSFFGYSYRKRQFARVAASGGTGQPAISIVYREENTNHSGEWDIYNLFSDSIILDFYSYTIDDSYDVNNIPQAPDIVCRRGVNPKFTVAYTINSASFNSVKYSTFKKASTYNYWQSQTMNHLSGALRPKPGVKYSDNDSCFCIWSGSGGNNIWSTNSCTDFSNSTLDLSAMIQGFYNPSSNSMIPDTVHVYLRKATSPYARVDSSKGVLNSSGTGSFNFSNADNNVNYYLVIKHRNSIETWSSSGNFFISGNMSYSFLTASNKAYGSNQVQIDNSPLRFAIYSGDVNKDGSVDLTDILLVYNDANNFVTGYKSSDVNGDNVTDLSDIVITYNNSNNFVSVIKP